MPQTNQIDYLNESISLMFHLANGKTYSDLVDEVIKKRPIDRAAFQEEKKDVLAFLEEIDHKAASVFKDDMEDIRLYFAPINPDSTTPGSLGNILLNWSIFFHPNIYTIEEYHEELLNKTDKEYYAAIYELLYTISSSYCERESTTEECSLDELLTFIVDENYDSSILLLLEDGILRYKEHLDRLFALLTKSARFLKKYEKKMLALTAQADVFWQKELQGQDILDYALNKNPELLDFGIVSRECASSYEIFFPFKMGISFSSDFKGKENTFFIPIGILFGKNYILFYMNEDDASKNDAYFIDLLKQISDKTRFEILSLIKDEAKFGNELAKQLGLTTATVSHHMGQLLNHCIVSFELSGNKMYYRSQKETIAECLNYLSNKFNLDSSY